jgi:8-oxo-dGTP pyrophosphatase MutT (NUDIX family)
MIAPRILNRMAARLADALAPPARRLLPWIVDEAVVGHLDERRASLLDAYRDVFVVGADAVRLHARLRDADARTQALDAVARDLAQRGELSRWRDERYPVRCPGDDKAQLLIERAAARFFGIHSEAAHVNGLARANGATSMWIARRSPGKAIDPGQLDNLVGGGIAAGAGVLDTVVKEAWEEAGIPAHVARGARPEGRVGIRRLQHDGLQWETIHVHDLVLPAGFAPSNQDGEVVDFRLVTPADAALLASHAEGDDVVTADASLVIADWLMRSGEVAAGSPAYAALDALRLRPS